MPDIGELVVGAWLTEVEGYDFVVYNQRPGRHLPESIAPKGLAGVSARLSELDVIGLHTSKRQSYLAECTTHLGGLLMSGGAEGTISKLKRKFQISSAYASVMEKHTDLKPRLALWSPRVPQQIVKRLNELQEAAARPIELVANVQYSDCIRQLVDSATKGTTDTGNDFYRTLQLLTHVTTSPFVDLPKQTKKRVAEAAAELASQVVLPWSEVVKVHKTQAGIRAPRGAQEASLICNISAHGSYPDRFLGADVLHYVGRGLEGDQELDRENESLRQAVERGVPIHVFQKLGTNRYLDHGDWEGVGDPLWHLEQGTGRRLIVFSFRRLDAAQDVEPQG